MSSTSSETPRALTSRAHALVLGVTGTGERWGGKSVLCNWWLTQAVERGWYDVGIYFNPKGDNLRGATVSTMQGLAQSYRSGKRLFDFRPRSLTGEREHAELMEFCRSLPGSKMVVHDEASDYAEDGGSLHWAVKRGGNEANLKSVVVSQSPTDLPTGVRKQTTTTVWVGPITADYKHYFSQLGQSEAYEYVREHVGPHEWVVIDAGGSELTHMAPVPAEYA